MKRQAVVIANSVTSQRTQKGFKRGLIHQTAEQIGRVLEGLPAKYAFDVLTAVDENARRLRQKVSRAAGKAAGSGTLLLVYYFGHARLQGDDLAFVHPSAGRDRKDYLEFQALLHTIAAERAEKVLLILDCCYAGAGAYTLDLHRFKYCLMACPTASTRAWYDEDTERPMGVFTRSVLAGFSDPEGAESVTDDSITAASLFAYAKQATTEHTADLQIPYMSGDLDEALSNFSSVPVINPGVSPEAPVKSGYRKLLAILMTIGKRKLDTINDLYQLVLRSHREVFLTPFKEPDGRITERPAQPIVLQRYISFLRAVGAIDDKELMLTVSGMDLTADNRKRYNEKLLRLLDKYLSQYDLTRERVRSSMQSILHRRWLTTKKNVLTDLALTSSHSLNQAKLGMLLDLLGHIGVIGMPRRREQVYFPWSEESRGGPESKVQRFN